MNEHDRLIEEPRLFDQLCSTLYLSAGFEQVKKNKGKPGIDGVTIADFEARLDEELSRLQQELQDWTYQPSPVRRVEIPKPGGKGVRLLGIPTVRDRVVQTTLKLLLEPIFDPHFQGTAMAFVRDGVNTKRCKRRNGSWKAVNPMWWTSTYRSSSIVFTTTG
ncbi:hypothetical protein Q9L42_003640 [Methylomarinum sp. Ch1-1]|uniref:Uncharacterized protein n=1 Tax=Methylomarinum roseum TaxID=3067653 RepID=A0AAU7NST4_9GAMM